MKKPLTIAYYLPQFHEINENNIWWGQGFTEWTALNKAMPLFKNQKIRMPIPPYKQYFLPSKEVMEWQAQTAKSHHIDGFFMWDYWFGNGVCLLNKPKEFVRDNQVDFPYALIWANHSWYDKTKNQLLMQQKYLGRDDYIAYARSCIAHFANDNYIKVNNSPIFGIFLPSDVPDLDVFMDVFETIAISYGFNGIYWVSENSDFSLQCIQKFSTRVNSSCYFKDRKFHHPFYFIREQGVKRLRLNSLGPIKYSYKKLVCTKNKFNDYESPAILTGWDTTPRHGIRGTFLSDFSVEAFSAHLENVFLHVKRFELSLVVIKSWNEWAEGNVLEPDNIYGYSLLDILKDKIETHFNVS